jgi:heme exporter protein A
LDGLEALPAAIAYLSLGDVLEQKCKTLSSGMRKKLSLARLMLSSAPIWLLDEIQTNLDEHNLQLLQGLIASKISSGGIIIISTHIKPPKGQILNLEDFS